jgi:hypothetical protein
MSEPAPRPTQVTLAAWLVVGGSLAVVLSAFDQIAGLNSLETREAVQEALGRPPADALGLGLEGALSLIRVLTMISAACATAAIGLGVQVLRRYRPARLVLTILALPLFATGLVLGGIVPAIVAGAITMLWFQPSRAWLDGTPMPARTSSPAPAAPAAPTASAAPAGSVDVQPTGVAQPGSGPWPPSPTSPTRPGALVWACGLAWFGCLMASMLMLGSLLVVLVAPGIVDQVFEDNPQLDREAISTGLIQATVAAMAGITVAWSVAASVFAWFALRGRSWAWVALLISASTAAIACFALTLGNPLLLVPTMVCAITVPLLLRPEVRAFLDRGAAPRR